MVRRSQPPGAPPQPPPFMPRLCGPQHLALSTPRLIALFEGTLITEVREHAKMEQIGRLPQFA